MNIFPKNKVDHQARLTEIYGYKFNIGDIVKHVSYTDLYGEVIERGSNPVTNYYIIRQFDTIFKARYSEDDLSNEGIVIERMTKLKELGI